MKAKTKFMKMYSKLPYQSKRDLIYNPYSNNPMSLNVIMVEVKNNTELGKSILKDLGFEDD